MLKVARSANVLLRCLYEQVRDAVLEDAAVYDLLRHDINPASDFDPPIYDPDYALKICKKAPSIFFETGWANYFMKDRVDTAIITGCKHRWMHPCGRNR